ncbi:hypothetical protein [Gymnodinialimonas ulvae]|uniref:hypothetical protein n=1 Tax=Gymnodinialimonas ulvae TaxID=3126504 RepID=UPI0030A2460D
MADEQFFKQLAQLIAVSSEYNMPLSRDLEETLYNAVAMDLGLSPKRVEIMVKLHSKEGVAPTDVERYCASLN